jgi:hypothetical protein
MIRTFIRYLNADLRSIAGSRIMLQLLLAPVIIVLLQRILLNVVSFQAVSENGFQIGRYYSLSIMTFISSVPVIIGFFTGGFLTYGFVSSDKIDLNADSPFRESLHTRLAESVLISLVVVIILVFAVNPVESEGWLRILYVSFLLSLQSAHIVLFIVLSRMGRESLTPVYILAAYFLLAIPSGLLIDSPWNMVAFLSPFYWINWAWVSPSLAESIISGVFSISIISGIVVLLFVKRRKANKT